MYQAIYKDLAHPDVANTLNNMGNVHWNQARYAAAWSCYEQAYAMRKQCLGENHRDTQYSLKWRNKARAAQRCVVQ